MRVLVAGLGIQGHKRKEVAGRECIATVDPANSDADYRHISEISPAKYEGVLICVPDEEKINLIRSCIKNKKHVLVEKPLWATSKAELAEIEALARDAGILIYTAYNHRFEPSFIKMKKLLESEVLGELYTCRIFYGNGTARLVRGSVWKDKGSGVLIDLGSHLLDSIKYWFGDVKGKLELVSMNNFENQSPDHAVVLFQNTTPRIELEMTLLSWKNYFSCDIFAEYGSAHIKSLCKWGTAEFSIHRRVLPSGPPMEENYKFDKGDPTWLLEYEHFKFLCSTGVTTNFSHDLWIYDELKRIETSVLKI
ncbi:Gfo/Idh/MocA family oxidoreductase [bacterium]|nr:Gfo/Idh/MocA family oxidoreductase [bacterium]